MRPRNYIDRIDIYRTTAVPDGFGGNTTESDLIGSSWCNVRTLRAESVTELGLSQNDLVIEINLRKRQDISYTKKDTYFNYKGNDFNIVRIEPVGLEGYEIKILASSKDFNDA